MSIKDLPELPEGHHWDIIVDFGGDFVIRIMKTVVSGVTETVKSLNPDYRWWNLSGIPKYLYTKVKTGEKLEIHLPIQARTIDENGYGDGTFTGEQVIRTAKDMLAEFERREEMKEWINE